MDDLTKDRARFREEMKRFLFCKTKKQKQLLWDNWRERYADNPDHIRELVNCARNKEVAMQIANWKLKGET